MGLTTDAPFDRAVIWDPQGGTYIDDLHFGPPIPAPPAGALLLVGFGAFFRQRRRRGPEIFPSAPS
jgi:MYXO-CTERM domain-containing protein